MLQARIDMSQITILPKLARYCELINQQLDREIKQLEQKGHIAEARKKTLEKRDPKLISTLKSDTTGYCHAYSVLIFYALWLESQPKDLKTGVKVYRDDWTWLQGLLTRISIWQGNTLDDISNKNEIEYFLQSLIFFQNSFSYLNVGFGELQTYFEDTRKRTLNKEYSLAGQFTPIDFNRPIPSHPLDETKNSNNTLLDEIIKEDKFVLVSAPEHDTGFYKHHDVIFFINANLPQLVIKIPISSKGNAITALFLNNFEDYNPNDMTTNQFAPLGFRVFGFGKTSATYQPQSVLLEKLAATQSRSIQEFIRANHRSGLHQAVFVGCLASVKYHLEHGTDINIKDLDDFTPLHLAAENGNADILSFLLENKADVNAKDKYDITPLHLAIKNHDILTAQKLLEKNSDVNAQESKNGFSAFHLAAFEGDETTVKLLLEQKEIKVNLQNLEGATALHLAAQSGFSTVVKLLLSNPDINVNVQDNLSYTALHIAVQNNSYYIAYELLAKDADIHALTDKKQSAFDLAKMKNNVKMMAILQFKQITQDHLNWLFNRIGEIVDFYKQSDKAAVELLQQNIKQIINIEESKDSNTTFFKIVMLLQNNLTTEVDSYNKRFFTKFMAQNPYKNDFFSAINLTLKEIETTVSRSKLNLPNGVFKNIEQRFRQKIPCANYASVKPLSI